MTHARTGVRDVSRPLKLAFASYIARARMLYSRVAQLRQRRCARIGLFLRRAQRRELCRLLNSGPDDFQFVASCRDLAILQREGKAAAGDCTPACFNVAQGAEVTGVRSTMSQVSQFCLIHQSLPVTPVMEAGVSDRVCSLSEIIPRCNTGSRFAAVAYRRNYLRIKLFFPV